MTEIPDLCDDPKQRLDNVFVEFVKKLEKRQAFEEERMDRWYEQFRYSLHRLHKKTASAYKHMCQRMLEELHHNKDAEAAAFFEAYLRSEKKELYAEIFERATPVLRDIQISGGSLEFSVRHAGNGVGSCIFSQGRNDYFDFLGEFLDGFDSDEEYKVTTRRRDKERSKKEEDEFHKKAMSFCYGSPKPKNDEILAEAVNYVDSQPDALSAAQETGNADSSSADSADA